MKLPDSNRFRHMEQFIVAVSNISGSGPFRCCVQSKRPTTGSRPYLPPEVESRVIFAKHSERFNSELQLNSNCCAESQKQPMGLLRILYLSQSLPPSSGCRKNISLALHSRQFPVIPIKLMSAADTLHFYRTSPPLLLS